MARTRVILALLISGLVLGEYCLAVSGLEIYWRVVLHGFGALLMLVAAFMLTCSFFRVDTLPNGELCYNPSNPFWRAIESFYSKVEDWNGKISLCAAYWTVVCMSIVYVMIAVILAGFAYTLYTEKLGKLAPIMGFVFGGVLVALAVAAAVAFLLGKLINKFPWTAYPLLGSFFVGIFIIFPIAMIQKGAEVPVSTASGYYGLGVLALAVAIGLGILAFKYIKVLRNTALGMFFASAKEKVCPMLTACSTPNAPCGELEELSAPSL